MPSLNIPANTQQFFHQQSNRLSAISTDVHAANPLNHDNVNTITKGIHLRSALPVDNKRDHYLSRLITIHPQNEITDLYLKQSLKSRSKALNKLKSKRIAITKLQSDINLCSIPMAKRESWNPVYLQLMDEDAECKYYLNSLYETSQRSFSGLHAELPIRRSEIKSICDTMLIDYNLTRSRFQSQIQKYESTSNRITYPDSICHQLRCTLASYEYHCRQHWNRNEFSIHSQCQKDKKQREKLYQKLGIDLDQELIAKYERIEPAADHPHRPDPDHKIQEDDYSYPAYLALFQVLI